MQNKTNQESKTITQAQMAALHLRGVSVPVGYTVV